MKIVEIQPSPERSVGPYTPTQAELTATSQPVKRNPGRQPGYSPKAAKRAQEEAERARQANGLPPIMEQLQRLLDGYKRMLEEREARIKELEGNVNNISKVLKEVSDAIGSGS